MTKSYLSIFIVAAACGKGSPTPTSVEPSAKPVAAPTASAVDESAIPPRPVNGAPLSLEQKSITPGGKLIARAYNFTDKTLASYSVHFRYYDASGAYIKPEQRGFDYESTSFAGPDMKCAPKSWCELEITDQVPKNAVKAVMFADELGAVMPDGLHMEEKPVFNDMTMQWPLKS